MARTEHLTRFTETDDPVNLESYRRLGGFLGLEASLGMEPDEVVQTVKDAHLAGRGGAGVDAGFKWSTVPRDQESFIVCNADEGEPGTFKDRFLLEKAPYLILEGMTIAGYAVGSRKGFIYIRGEYPAAMRRLERAIAYAREAHMLGDGILGSEFAFDIEVLRGGGSYVVGDETALLNSLMGNRGYPLHKPPYPTKQGLWDKPTLVNNVESLACVSLILSNGPQWFSTIGAETSPGPKLYPISGHVREPGVYEFPMGARVDELIEAAGGVRGTLKAVQIGGTAGPVYGEAARTYHLDFDSMRMLGGALGSGALVVMNSSVSMVQVLEVTMRFFAEESCGQCFGCRYGTRQLDYMARRIASGHGRPEYIRKMRDVARVMRDTSFCPFGRTVVLPLETLLDGFGAEIEDYITQQAFLQEVG